MSYQAEFSKKSLIVDSRNRVIPQVYDEDTKDFEPLYGDAGERPPLGRHLEPSTNKDKISPFQPEFFDNSLIVDSKGRVIPQFYDEAIKHFAPVTKNGGGGVAGVTSIDGQTGVVKGIAKKEDVDKLAAQLSETSVDVKSFGAKGDGVTDDSASFTDAISKASNSKELLIPSGIYVVNDLVLLNGVRLVGVNKPSIILNKSVNIASLSNVSIENIKFTTNNSFVGCFEVTDSQAVLFKDCDIDGKGFLGETPLATGMARGINVLNSLAIEVINCEIKNMKTGKGVEFENCTDCKAEGNYVHHTGRAGVSIASGNLRCRAIDNRLEFNVLNFTVSDGALDLYGPNNTDSVLTGNKIDNYGSSSNLAIGIRIKGSKDTFCANNTVTTCPNSLGAIYVEERNGVLSTNTTLESNVINSAVKTSYVIRVSDDTSNLAIKNNLITGQGLVSNAFVEVRRSCLNFSYEGNTIDCSGVSAQGLAFSSLGTSFKHLKILNNFHKHIGGVALGKCENVICEGNSFDSETFTSQGAINTSACSNVFLLNNFISGTLPRVTTAGEASTNVVNRENVLITTV